MAEKKKITKQGVLSNLYAFLLMLLGSLFVSFALNQVLKPAGFVPGGVTGIATVVHSLSGGKIPIGALQFTLNIPLFIWGWKTLGRSFIIRSLIGTAMASIAVDALSFTANYWVLETDPILAAIAGGIALGTGYGLVFRTGATTGGTDIIGRILQSRLNYMTLGQILLIFNIIFMAFVALSYKSISAALYTGVAVFISSKVVDQVEGGVNYAKEIYLVSDKADEIGADIIKELGRGATVFTGRGLYTGREHSVLWVVVYNRQLPKVREIAARHDPNVFLAIKDVREAKGLTKMGRMP